MLHIKNSSLKGKTVRARSDRLCEYFHMNNWPNLEHTGTQHPLLFILSDFYKDSIKVAGLMDPVWTPVRGSDGVSVRKGVMQMCKCGEFGKLKTKFTSFSLFWCKLVPNFRDYLLWHESPLTPFFLGKSYAHLE